MGLGSVNGKPADRHMLDELEKTLLEKHRDPEILRAYHHHAVATGQISRARKTFVDLQKCFPNDRNIRSLHIALCLKQLDYAAAIKEIEKLMSFGTPQDEFIDAALQVRKKLGPTTINQALNEGNTISICMIVKDEIANIGACLENAKALADEIIVVDTGSTDRSLDVAAIFGARTFTYAWRDDFAAARNYSIDQAKGDWILILDADEMIASRDHAALRQQVSSRAQKPIALSITTRNYTQLASAFQLQSNDGSYPEHEAGRGWIPSNKVRLFPRIKGVRFRYPVHERVDSAVKECGLTIERCTIPVHHYGDLNENKKKQKARVYFQLGFAKLKQLGDDVAAIRELAVQAGQLEHWHTAIELWERLLAIRPNFAEAYTNIAGACWQIKEYGRALCFAEKALTLDPGLKEAKYNAAVSQLFLGKVTEAAQMLSDLKVRYPGYLPVRLMLAATCACTGDARGCAEELEELKKLQDDSSLAAAIRYVVKRLQEADLHQFAKRLEDQLDEP